MAQYAEIVEIEGPVEAAPGTRVDIIVWVKNLYQASIGIMVAGSLEYGVSPWPGITFPVAWGNIPAGQAYGFPGYFTMPDSRVTIHAYSYWYGQLDGGGLWTLDGTKTKDVELLTAATAQFRNLSSAYS